MARGGPADLCASRELQTASVALRILYLELRPHRDAREWAVLTTAGATLAAAAFGVRVQLSAHEADALVAEGLALGLFELRERVEAGAVESLLAVAPLPPSVWRARYADRRGPRGGKSDAERQRERRERRRESSPSAPDSSLPSGDARELGARTASLPGEAVAGRDLSRPESPVVTASERDRSVIRPVTETGGGVSLSPLPGDPFRGVSGEGGGDTPKIEPQKPQRSTWADEGRRALELLSEGTAKALDASAVAVQWRHLGRALIERKIGPAELELTAAWLRENPGEWRKVLPRAKGLLLTVEHLLGERVDNIHTASGLVALLGAAREWDRRRSRPGPVDASPAQGAGLSRAEFEARFGRMGG